jgi:hypothetical protein
MVLLSPKLHRNSLQFTSLQNKSLESSLIRHMILETTKYQLQKIRILKANIPKPGE